MKWLSSKRPRSLLGLALAGNRLACCHVARSNGSVSVVKTATATLPADLLTMPDAAAAGRMLREAFVTTGIRERVCAVVLPAAWVMSQRTKVPALSAEDLASFLQLEAEKGFPVDPAQLQVATSTCRAGDATYVTQLAVRQEQLTHLAAVLMAAGLKPVSFSPGLTTLPGVLPPTGAGRVTVAIEPAGATLLVAAGGGIAALRTCEAGDSLARELRITFEQVPAELRAGLTQLRVAGDESLIRPVEGSLATWARAAGLDLASRGASERPLDEQMAEQVARRSLEPVAPDLEFLPPRPSRFAVLLARYDSKRLGFVGVAAAAVVVIALGAFGWQQYRRWSLRSEWDTLRAQSGDLAAVQTLIRDYRPWYDNSFHSLSILRRVTENFPDNGSVTAKSFEIRGTASVSISGTAQDNPALLHAVDQLRKSREIQDLKIEQIRGKTPLQFTLSFRWREGSGS